MRSLSTDKGLIVVVVGVVCLISLGGFLLNSNTNSNQTLAQARSCLPQMTRMSCLPAAGIPNSYADRQSKADRQTDTKGE